MSEKLKPCPFCGSPAEHTSKPNVEIISCTLCDMGRAYDGSGTALIAMWNTRTDSEEIEKLKAELSEAIELLCHVRSETDWMWAKDQIDALISKHK